MKKSLVLFLFLAIFVGDGIAQDSEIKVKIGGFVRYEAYYDTYSSVVSRDGELYLFPKAANFDNNGIDINDYGTLNMLSHLSKFNIKASGPEIFGAKSSALIEADFFGTGQTFVRLLRLRHAYMKLNWEKQELLVGHAYHPMFVPQCYPGTLTFAVAVPFNPINRSNQIRATLKPTENLSFAGAALMHTYHKSSGPGDAQRDAGLPDLQFQFMFTPGDLLIGGTAGYKLLKPRAVTEGGSVTNQTIGSVNLQGFAKYAGKGFSIKAMTVFGENLTNFVSIGGYGAAEDPATVDNYTYSNIQTITYWTEITLFKNPQIGLFAGYAENLGAKGEYFSLGYGRAENMAKTYRLSPRVTYKIKNLTLGFEVLYAVAIYGETFDSNYKAITYQDPTSNTRFLFASIYNF